MSSDKSGAGYGNHGGDESFEDKKNEGGDPTRDVPDDSGKGGYEKEGEDEAGR